MGSLWAIKHYDSDMEGGDYQGARHKYLAVFKTKEEAEAFVNAFVNERSAGIAYSYDGEVIVCKPEVWTRSWDYWSLQNDDGVQRDLEIEEFKERIPKKLSDLDVAVVEEIG